MFDQISGLPVHPLVVHLAVVMIPLFALCTIAYCALPNFRDRLRAEVVVTGVLAFFGAWFAAGSGEELEHRLKGAPGVDQALVHDHAEAGDLLRIVTWVLVVLTLVAVFTVLKPVKGGMRGVAAKVVAVLLVLGSLFVGYQTYVTGHSGAKATWGHNVPKG